MSVSFVRSRWLFLRLLGVVYLIAFASLAAQITGLVGEHGILPAREFLSRVHEVYGSGAYRLLPTLAWSRKGAKAYAVDGGVYDAGAAIDWARRIGLVD